MAQLNGYRHEVKAMKGTLREFKDMAELKSVQHVEMEGTLRESKAMAELIMHEEWVQHVCLEKS